jgi:hypothetical protein
MQEMTCATSESSLFPTMQATREQMQASCCRKNMKACNDEEEDECHSTGLPAAIIISSEDQIKSSGGRIEGSYAR